MLQPAINSELYLNEKEKHTYRELFQIADTENKSYLAKQEAMTFFHNAGIPVTLLDEIWQSADEGNKEYITETEFYVALKLVACAQHGIEADDDNILSTQAPLPQFKGITIKPLSIEIGPITATEREQYIKIFQSCHLVDGLLYGDEARVFFMKSNLPVDKLNAIWTLADTRHSGTLNKTEFIIAMHYLSRLMSNPSLTLPPTLPPQTYTEATGKFATSIRRHNTTMASPILRNRSPAISHMTGSTSSFSTTTMTSSLLSVNQQSYSSVAIPPEEFEKYKPYFNQLDTDGSGFIEAEEAVYFFSHSHLPESELGLIWEIADSRHLGKLDLHDFSVAMHLINMRKNGESIDRYYANPICRSPLQSNQATLNQQYELEYQLIELKQQVVSQTKALAQFEAEYQEDSKIVNSLEIEVAKAKSDMEDAGKAAEEAETSLNILKQKRDELFLSMTSATFVSSLPELTRAPSTFSGISSVMSPPSDHQNLFDPFAGFKKFQQQATSYNITPTDPIPRKSPLSPTQTKAVSKYGFDITAFDALSVSDDTKTNEYQKTSFNDDLASLFGSPIPTITKPTSANPNFDDIFM